jgi:hypothetical protein
VHKGVWWGNVTEGNHFEDPGIGGRIILKWIFQMWDGAWTGLTWLRIFLDHLNNYQLFKSLSNAIHSAY